MGCAATKPEERGTTVQPPCQPAAPPRRVSCASNGSEIRRRRRLHPSPPPVRSTLPQAPDHSDRRVEVDASEGSEHNATYGSLTDTAYQPSPFGITHETGDGAPTTPPEFSLAVLRFKADGIVSPPMALEPQDRHRSSVDRPEMAGREDGAAHTQPEVAPAERVSKSVEHRPLPPISPSICRSRQFLLTRFNQRGPTVGSHGGGLHSIAGEADQNLQPQLREETQRVRPWSLSSGRESPAASPDERDKVTSSPHRPPSTGGYLSIEPEPLWWKARFAPERPSIVERFRRYRDTVVEELPEDEPSSSKGNWKLVRDWLSELESPTVLDRIDEPFVESDSERPTASTLSPTVSLLPIPSS